MLLYLARRLAAAVPVLGIVGVMVFLMLRLAPGDPAAVIAGNSASDQDIAQIRTELGLDRPLAAQFVLWAGRMASGDFGESYYYKKTVASLIADRVEPTLALATLTILLAVAVAIPLGTLAASRAGSWLDRSVMGFSVLGFSAPVFVVGYVLIYVFCVTLGWFPVQGYQRIEDGIGGFLYRLVLPSITLSIVYIALLARITRTSVMEILNEDHVRTARAKGLSGFQVVVKHALRNAAVPIVTVIGVSVALLISGVVVTESVFNIPGLGRLTVDAVLARDYPTVQAVVLLFALVYIGINLLVDLAYVWLDPRIRY
jgi:peptide/nickel transport system permease protein